MKDRVVAPRLWVCMATIVGFVAWVGFNAVAMTREEKVAAIAEQAEITGGLRFASAFILNANAALEPKEAAAVIELFAVSVLAQPRSAGSGAIIQALLEDNLPTSGLCLALKGTATDHMRAEEALEEQAQNRRIEKRIDVEE